MQKKYTILLTSIIIGINLFIGLMSYQLGYIQGADLGYNQGIYDAVELFETQTGYKVTVIEQAPGSYLFSIEQTQDDYNLKTQFTLELHLWARQYRSGTLISETYHAMSLTTYGKNWICDNLANSAGTNVTLFARYISISNDSSAFDAAWTALPNEITGSGLARALGTFTDTGTGTWNMSKTFTATGTVSSKLYGLCVDSYAQWPTGGLIAAEQQGVGAQKNLVSGDTLAVTIQGTIS